MAAQERIARIIGDHNVVLFMKGTRQAPQCGFSQRVVDILDEFLDDYATVNVLADPDIREGIKAYSSWPTIPQLYVRQKFIGGSDIVHEMVQSGELADALGAEKIAHPDPEVTLTEGAVAAVQRFWTEEGDPVLRLTVGADFVPLLDLDEERPGDVALTGAPGLTLVMTRATARRAHGVTIDFVEQGGQVGFRVDNPNKPPSVQALGPVELFGWMKESKPHLLIDVRTEQERATAKIEPSAFLDDAFRASMADLDRDKTLVFYCHHGMRSRRAAEHAVALGFRDVHNLEGGIDAWSQEVDPDVPRY